MQTSSAIDALVGATKPDCNNCPSFCCYALSRPSGGFDDPSNHPTPCKHLDVCSTCSCTVHHLLESKSRTCDQYTCFGAGNIVTEIFGENTQGFATSHAQDTFRHIEPMCKWVGLFGKFVEKTGKHELFLERLKTTIIEILKKMKTGKGQLRSLADEFYTVLSEYMRRYKIGLISYQRTGEKEFVEQG